MSNQAHGSDQPDPRRWFTLGVLCLSLFMVVMGNTVLNIALPTISSRLDATGSDLQWIVDAYALVFAGMLFTAGSLGDRYGRKGALNLGLVIFGSASALATMASSAHLLIACRALMGLGAAFVMPATLSVLTHVFPPHERAKAIGAWAGVAGSAGAIGPIASGWLLEHFSWGSVFWLNVPVVVAALVLGWFLVPTSRHPGRVPIDPVGALLSIGAIGSLVYGFIEAPRLGWSHGSILGSFGVAAVLLIGFVAWELRSDHPMLDVRLFRRRGFTGGSVAISMMFFGMFGMFFMMTQYMQMVRGYSALEAGLRTLPFALTMMVSAPMAPRVVARVGARRTVPVGMSIAAIGMLLLGNTSGVDSSYALLVVSLMVLAGGMGLTMAPSTATIMASVPFEQSGIGSATNDTTRELGGALGIAVLGTVLASVYGHSVRPALTGIEPALADDIAGSLGQALRRIPELGPDAPAVIAAARQAYVDGLTWALTIGAVVALVGALVVRAVLPRGIGIVVDTGTAGSSE